jgi:hypothetical protein
MDFDLKLYCHKKISNKIVGSLGGNKANIRKNIIKNINMQIDRIMERVSPLLKEINISPNTKLDTTLSSPINVRNQLLEINSIARLFNDKIPETKTKFFPGILDASVPYVTSLDSQLQIYISEFTVNSVIYTLLVSNEREIKGKFATRKLRNILPGIVEAYGNEAYIVLTGTSDVSLQITEENLIVKLKGALSLRSTSNQEFLRNEIDLILKVFVRIQNGERLTAEVDDVDCNFYNFTVNALSVPLSLIYENIEEIRPFFIPLLNDYIINKMEYKFPTVRGIKFTQLTLEHKNHYLLINYNLVRE